MKNKHILIIEDDKVIAEKCQEELVKHGYEVKLVTNSTEGIDFLKHSTPEIILLDCGNADTHSCKTLATIKHLTESKSRIMILPESEKHMEEFIENVEQVFSKCHHCNNDTKIQYIHPGKNTFKIKNPYSDNDTNKDIEITIEIKI